MWKINSVEDFKEGKDSILLKYGNALYLSVSTMISFLES